MSDDTLCIPAGGAEPGLNGVIECPEPWRLYHGDWLERPRIAFRLIGPSDAPVVAVLGGISAHRAPAGADGWWREFVGPHRGVDTTRFRVLGMDYLGGLGESSTPDGAGAFPPVSSVDQADALCRIVRHLRLGSLHAVVGASYGGMVALCLAARHAQAVGRIVILSASERAHVLSTAWRSVQRQIVREALVRGDGAAGLKLARALAMATYRSPAEFAARFAGPPIRAGGRFRFPVESYLFARGDDYVQKYRAESFLSLSESIDLHAVDASQVRTPATLIAIRQDQLVPFGDMHDLAGRLAGVTRFHAIDSIFGHDAFLKENTLLNPLIDTALTEAPI
ncbi:MAG: homoserine O-succinyltransferase [Pseudomonadota bacterium]|nr:homoserine O-succinyltransferase [Pseudomonadota bacterium]